MNQEKLETIALLNCPSVEQVTEKVYQDAQRFLKENFPELLEEYGKGQATEVWTVFLLDYGAKITKKEIIEKIGEERYREILNKISQKY